ncbi:KAP family P-loop NTPase fold protein [Agarilytica rhodophyticola]|uniref:KAP family P-loop NTPase fold protein n=1 Tax=Agarilytica rhodophyticola TaxID=1737490 RepID=UPI000B347505|nr:P-loop NTPase fold protein [Agarilytica rhodophyticola]
MDQPVFSEQIKRLITDISKKDSAGLVLFAARCALRVFPLVVVNDTNFSYWSEGQRAFNLLSTWRAAIANIVDFPYDPRFLHEYASNAFLSANYASDHSYTYLAYKAIAHASMAFYAYATEDKYLTNLIGSSLAASESAIAACRVLESLSKNEEEEQYKELNILNEGTGDILKHAPLWIDIFPPSEYLTIVEKVLPSALDNLAEEESSLSSQTSQLVHAVVPIYQNLYTGTYSKKSLMYEWEQLNRYFQSYEKTSDSVAVDEKIGGTEDTTRYRASQQLSYQDASTHDALDRKKLVETLAGFLLHPANHHHQTIGLLGDWGVGKSSVIKQLRNLLIKKRDKQDFLLAEFNAWAYEHTDNLQAGVAQEVIRTLSERLPSDNRFLWVIKRFFLITRFAIRLHGKKLLSLMLLLLLVVIPPFFEAFNQMLKSLFPQAKHAKEIIIMTGGVGFLLFLWKQLKPVLANPMAKELLTYLKLPNYGHHLGTIPVMRETIKTLCNIRLQNFGKEKRLLFVVDDLDRCGHEGIVKVFEAVRLVLDIPNVTVVIAVDQRIALAALALHYKELADFHELRSSKAIARDYLAKVIHIPITLSEPSKSSVHRYLHDIWEKTEAAMDKDTSNQASDELKEDAQIRNIIEETENKILYGERQEIENPNENFHGRNNIEAVLNTNDSKPVDSKPRDNEHEVKIIERLSNMQKQSFLYWLDYFNLNNPRQIKRLNNCYNLLRSYYDEDEQAIPYSSEDDEHIAVYPIMLTLFVLEYINGLDDMKRRKKLKNIIFENKNNVMKSEKVEDPKITADILAVLCSQFKQLVVVDLVEPFVLPAIEIE